MSDNERRFRKLARQGAIEAIRKRCNQLRTETEDGLVLHAANDIEQQGEMLYRHTKDLAIALAEAEARAALLVDYITDLEDIAGRWTRLRRDYHEDTGIDIDAVINSEPEAAS